ncbi:MAG: peptidylprolyl isomerase [Gammaproteobacteria bacterium]|nr:peptidylprolyl isomerase [Gammaproteobacteria bacterium]
MQLKKDMVATINYNLKDDDGNTIDESTDGSFSYLHGAKNIIPGLENALDGKEAGDEFSITIEPADAYGEKQLENIQRVPREMFPPDIDIQAGMQFNARTSDDQPLTVMVTAVEGNEVIVDGNHPLAGKRLHFDVELVDVREASQEELDHGHAHQPGESEH